MIQILQPRKTRKGYVGFQKKLLYLSSALHCGLLHCPACPPHLLSSLSLQRSPTIYLPDDDLLLRQAEVLLSLQQLGNVLLLQSSLARVHSQKKHEFVSLKERVETSSHTKFYVYPNLYSAQCNVPHSSLFLNSVRFLHAHYLAAGATLLVLTNNFKTVQELKKEEIKCMSLIELLKDLDSQFLEFMGVEGQMQEQLPQLSPGLHQSHLSLQELKRKTAQGKLLRGKLNRQKLYVKLGNKADVLVQVLDTNRALFGDVVAVQLEPESNWIRQVDLSAVIQDIPLDQANNQAVESKLIDRLTAPGLIPTVRVRGVFSRAQRFYCGSLTDQVVHRTSRTQIRIFQPADSKFPNFYMRVRNPEKLLGMRIQVSFESWPEGSKFPFARFRQVVGPIGDLKTESDLILLEHNVQIADFSKEAYRCLPQEGPLWKIPPEELQKRFNFTDCNVCSIDPPGCKDIDDALHCRILPNGNLEVGVHIADVSYFVKADSALDQEAAKRCTTVYLVNRRTDMLPKLLTESLCSLVSGVDRLAFSVIWEFSPSFEQVSVNFGKSVIRSVRSLTYGEAQAIMDDPKDHSPLALSIRNLNRVAKALKAKRLQEGALQLASTQVKFDLDNQTHSPNDVRLYQLLQTNSLVEEFMLLANCATAQKTVQSFPSLGLLRKHDQPKSKQLLQMKQILGRRGFDLRFGSSKELAESLDSIVSQDPFFNTLVRIMITRCMCQALYFCTADNDPQMFRHYGLAAPLYTHFTSPIRRYADLIVHRLLAAALDLQALPRSLSNKNKMTQLAERMNFRHRMARFASSSSSDYHTYLFFKDRKTIDKAIVTSISSQSITLMLPQFGFECKVPAVSRGQDQVQWGGRRLRLFERVEVKVQVSMQSLQKKIELIPV